MVAVMLNNRHILIVRLSSIGDVLHATPVAKALKTAYPDCHITWLVSRLSSSLLTGNPYIDRVFIWSREEFEQAATNRQIGQLKKLWYQLKHFYQETHFDLVVDIHGLFLTGVITAASQAPRRIGMGKTRELNRFFMTEQAPVPTGSHVIDRYLSVLLPLGIYATDKQMTLQLSAADQAFAQTFFDENQIDPQKKILLINPMTSWTSKNWSNENFAKLLCLLPLDVQPLLCGSRHDKAETDKIKALCDRPLFDAVGKTSLTELAALVAKADLVLTGDTGALHIATALGTPTVSLWGPTTPMQYGPLTGDHTFIQSPHSCIACHKTKCRLHSNACMQAIEPTEVVRKINALLQMNHHEMDDIRNK